VQLLKVEEIKFSVDRFLANKWLFAKTNFAKTFQTYSRLDLFVTTRILRKFQIFAFKSQWIEQVKNRTFSSKSVFFINNRLIIDRFVPRLILKLFRISTFFYTDFFFLTINLSFYKWKTCFFQLFEFFSHIFFTSLESRPYAFSFLMAFRDFREKNAGL